MDAKALRARSLAFLKKRGFTPAHWLPLPNPEGSLRPTSEIAGRLMALGALFTWASAPESAVASDSVRGYIKQNGLNKWMTDEERKIATLSREKAQSSHMGSIGWKLENIWPLAWVLGFEAEPTIEASQIDMGIGRAILFDFLAGLNGTVDDLLEKAEPRSDSEVIMLEDRFYCAHNAVRSAQFGEDTVPKGFDPVAHGGVVHERRHALTWSLSPGVSWDDTDLST